MSPDGGLANVLVLVSKGLQNRGFPAPEQVVTVEYRRCLIEPYVVAVRTGQLVRFKNRDSVLHQVLCTPAKPGSGAFNLTLLPFKTQLRVFFDNLRLGRWPIRRPNSERQFSSSEVFVQIRCPLHPWEFGYIAVLDHPFFAVTDKDGRFELPPGLPPGKYVIEARHLKAGAVTQAITVAEGDRKQLNFTLEVPAGNRSR
ncbi:MAG: carboxypeptidase regulatory-like domain-containing protein [Limisphaerales bacterium]